jgi:hypothetical protein
LSRTESRPECSNVRLTAPSTQRLGNLGLKGSVAAVSVFALADEQEYERHERDTRETQQRGADGRGEASFPGQEQHDPRDQRKHTYGRGEDVSPRHDTHMLGRTRWGGLETAVPDALGHSRAGRNRQNSSNGA